MWQFNLVFFYRIVAIFRRNAPVAACKWMSHNQDTIWCSPDCTGCGEFLRTLNVAFKLAVAFSHLTAGSAQRVDGRSLSEILWCWLGESGGSVDDRCRSAPRVGP